MNADDTDLRAAFCLIREIRGSYFPSYPPVGANLFNFFPALTAPAAGCNCLRHQPLQNRTRLISAPERLALHRVRYPALCDTQRPLRFNLPVTAHRITAEGAEDRGGRKFGRG